MNNSNFQSKIISNYLNTYYLSDRLVSLDNFEYNFFTGNCNSDLIFMNDIHNNNDTIILIKDLEIELDFFDLVMFKEINLKNIYLDSTLINLSNIENNQKIDFSNFFSFNYQLTINKLELSNLMILTDQQILDNIDLLIDDIIINENNFSIQDISIKNDSFILNANSSIKDEHLIVNIEKLNLYDDNVFFKKHKLDNILSENKLAVNGVILINSDSILGSTSICSGDSKLHLDIIQKNNISSIDYLCELKPNDVQFSLLKSQQLDSLIFQGNLDIRTNKLLNEYNGFITSQFGSIHFNAENYEKNTTINFDLIDFDLDLFSDNIEIKNINSKGMLSFSDSDLTYLDMDIINGLFHDYNYQNIHIQSLPSNNDTLSYSIQIDDNNLKFNGRLNIDYFYNTNSVIYQPVLSGNINMINTNNLNINMNTALNSISTSIMVSGFNVASLDNRFFIKLLHPQIQLQDFSYKIEDNNKSLSFIKMTSNNNLNQFSLNSSIGNIHLMYDNDSSKNGFKYNTPFRLDLDLNKASVISDLFLTNIKLADNLKINADFQNKNFSIINVYSPWITYSNLSLFNIDFSTVNNNTGQYIFSVDSMLISDKLSLEDISLTSSMVQPNKSNYHLTYSSGVNQGELKGNLFFNSDIVTVNFNSESIINFFNQSWKVNTLSKLSLANKQINFQNFSLNMDGQKLILDGFLNNSPKINFSFIDFKLHYLNPFLNNESFYFDGVLDGDILFYANTFPMMSGNFEVDNFKLNDVLLGKLTLTNMSNQGNDSIFTNGIIRSNKEILTFLARYPLDGTKNINANILFNDFPANIFDTILNPISNLSGLSYGNIKVDGVIDDYSINGETFINNLEFNIPYLGTNYYSGNNSLILNFDNDSIFINSLSLYDKEHSTSAIIEGNIAHSSLKDMHYNLFIKSDSLYALNKFRNINKNYYGKAFLGGNMSIKGEPKTVQLDIDGASKKGSKILIPLTNSKEVQKNEFIQFVNSNFTKQTSSLALSTKPKFTMDFNLLIDTQSEIKLIFDEEVGDIITGYGQGDLSLKINKEVDFKVYGDFEIEKGDYLFTLQDVITKSFQIEKGGVINFDGDPYNANINLNLLYNVQASLNPLNSDFDRDKKSPVVCKMKMSGPLLNPEISFDINILNSDQIAETSLEAITNTDQKLLEQFLYLLIANSFLVENDPTIDYLGNTLATTGTELLSNQLSNWLSQTTDAFDLGFKWIPGTGDSLSYQQIELAVSKKFLDDRVVVNGNVGTPPEQSEANIVGDLDIEYDFFKDGKFKLRVFNRTKDYDPLSESLGYEQGFGIFFKKQFNNFKEIFIIDQNE
ncbi:MAG: hypothetical protein CMP49_02920 [Flavobacteriales bacterium]|nr:hypothetical protein [Flavobacteriales bacterium]